MTPVTYRALASTFALTAALHAPLAHAAVEATQLGWLAGCWRIDNTEAGSGEMWMPPAGGVLLGAARSMRAGRMSSFEFSRIAPLDDGRLAYIAQPGGAAPTTFPLISTNPEHLVFEQPEHDFPQRVIYRRVDRDHLAARIEGMNGGKLDGIDYPMTRTACEAAVASAPVPSPPATATPTVAPATTTTQTTTTTE